jgi:hypothetical protein
MLQQLATDTNAQPWVIASLLFFVGVYLIAALRIWRTSAAEAEGFARLPLDDDAPIEGLGNHVPRPDVAPAPTGAAASSDADMS